METHMSASNEPNTLCFTVRVTALIGLDDLDEEDMEVPGDHNIQLGEEAHGWSAGQQATAVLDQFHGSVAIGMLEDFEITVLNSKGEEIFEDLDEV
jgi:hypothetical protein